MNTSHDNTNALSLSTFWLRTAPSTLRILTDALHELHAFSELPRRDEDVAATALQVVLGREGKKRGVVWQPAEWYGVSAASGSGGDETAGRAVFARPGMENVFERIGQVRALVELARRSEGDEMRREMEKESASF